MFVARILEENFLMLELVVRNVTVRAKQGDIHLLSQHSGKLRQDDYKMEPTLASLAISERPCPQLGM